jgi:beta-glucosidase/6-phospho-beta-glucosidase/beta-galactosidase
MSYTPSRLPACPSNAQFPWSPQKEFHPRGGIIITENGCAVAEDDVDEALKDIERAVYLKRYLTEVRV